MTNLQLRSLDIPSIHKFALGFDSVFDELLRQGAGTNSTNYPPYNVVKHSEDKFSIELAVAGFNSDEITIQVHKQKLTITGKQDSDVEDSVEYLYRGISSRSFVREWTLAEHVKVRTATQENGILRVTLEREVPAEDRPKIIDIKYIK